MSTAAVITPAPQQQELGQQVVTWTQFANGLEITDESTADRASRCLVTVKELQSQADESFDPIIKKAYEAHREAIAQKKRIVEPLEQATATLKTKLGSWLEEERRRIEDEQRRLQAEADHRAAEQREAEIEEAEVSGATTEEIEVLAQAPLAVAPVLRTVPKLNGVSARQLWLAQVTDLQALVKFIAQNPQYLNLVQPNTTAINALARTLRSAAQIPGVKVWQDTGISVRR